MSMNNPRKNTSKIQEEHNQRVTLLLSSVKFMNLQCPVFNLQFRDLSSETEKNLMKLYNLWRRGDKKSVIVPREEDWIKTTIPKINQRNLNSVSQNYAKKDALSG